MGNKLNAIIRWVHEKSPRAGSTKGYFFCLGLINYLFIIICPLDDVPELISKLNICVPWDE